MTDDPFTTRRLRLEDVHHLDRLTYAWQQLGADLPQVPAEELLLRKYEERITAASKVQSALKRLGQMSRSTAHHDVQDQGVRLAEWLISEGWEPPAPFEVIVETEELEEP
ncbi:hypothetical protein SEA_LILBEANIE_72 [Gordonia phage Lilbeanie]|uniref:Uncharacterized protein n=1 Tax=Gordonia phage Lilbeanie TaxID=2794947 RepID=A0A7T1NWY4_9CAUD|nr:hypothetical protein J1773_gp72 [Gordonia phage Lilbeanie]QPO17150.1 hypothetical protein SEA_LILBEANIE_72 [Gordonia phage Lilbeanie]